MYKQSATPEHIGPVGTDTGARHLSHQGLLAIGQANEICFITFHSRKYISQEHVQRMIVDDNFGDISFAVGGGGETRIRVNAEKIAKTTPTMFYAHRDILRECSTGIYSPTFVDQML